MPAPSEVLSLVERFKLNLRDYDSANYNEAQLRQEFIDPLFKALGWDVDNERSYAEQWKEVVHEDALKVGGATKAPDYSFRLGGRRVFFLEAKRPAVNLKDDPAPAFQLRRYAWTAKLPLSILTNFDELIVYDTRVRPEKTDAASKARVLIFRYSEYVSRWDELVLLLSPESIRKGALDRFVESATHKRGTAEVDDAILAEIADWRKQLAQNIALRNQNIGQRELNFAVQMTIDRIIFMRICEDRGIEPYGQLLSLINGDNVYPRLNEIYRRADERYNSGLFHFQPEKDRSGTPDELTPRLAIDDRLLKGIIRRLYYPDSPYEFSVLPADILGQVYERFLGSVIHLTSSGHAKIDDKPEVRKAGGVYYTPTFIVNYIVESTVGKLLEGKTPHEVAGVTETWRPAKGRRPLSILDPACGSGSFLLGAYQFLLDWHLEHYLQQPEKWSKGRQPKLYRHHRGGWRLTTIERKRILLANIYGVDIDTQAVEVTKLSLLLKVLEGENAETLQQQLKLFHERALPDLAENIKCGNSLIGADFYNGRQMSMFDVDEQYRINAFDWTTGFADILAGGGFDAVIGNPPYVRMQTLQERMPHEAEYYRQHYATAAKGNYDIYVVFAEKGLQLLNDKGRLGFILPHKFFQASYGAPLRDLIAKGKHLAEVVDFQDKQVFAGATTYTCLLFLTKSANGNIKYIQPEDPKEWQKNGRYKTGEFSQEKITAAQWSFIVGSQINLFERLMEIPLKLQDVAERIFQGLVTGADKVFIMEKVADSLYLSKATQRTHEVEEQLMHLLCKGSVNIRRYHIAGISKSILFPYKLHDGKAELISAKDFEDQFPKTWAYLNENRRVLQSRERGKWKHTRWYAFARSQNLAEMEQKKLMTPSIASRASFTVDEFGHYYFVGSGGGGGGGYGITLKEEFSRFSYNYLLGLLNSKLLDWLLKQASSRFRGGYYAYNRQYIQRLPIRTIDFTSKPDKARHDKMVVLVQTMLDLHTKLAKARTPHEQTFLGRQIEAADAGIDRLVYELYGLSSEEISVVEEQPAADPI